MTIDSNYVQQNGQRFYGPPMDWAGPPPGRGCEVFFGKLPRDCFGEELLPIMSSVGSVYKMRLMMDFSGFNRGYCFVVFATNALALAAIQRLDGFAIRPGWAIGACLSVDNAKLAVQGIPEFVTPAEILFQFKGIVDGVMDVTRENRKKACVIVEFVSHFAATMARRRLIPGPTKMWGRNLVIDWAEPDECDVPKKSEKKTVKKSKKLNPVTDDANVTIASDVTNSNPLGQISMTTNKYIVCEEIQLKLTCQRFGWGEPVYETTLEEISGRKFYHARVVCPKVGLPLFLIPRNHGPFNADVLCESLSQVRQSVARAALCSINNLLYQQFPEWFSDRAGTLSSNPETPRGNVPGESRGTVAIDDNKENMNPESKEVENHFEEPHCSFWK